MTNESIHTTNRRLRDLTWQERQEIDRESKRRGNRTRKMRPEIWAKTDGRCWWCGNAMEWQGDFTADHVVPIVEGGSEDLSNLVPACKSCNSKKCNRSMRWLRRAMSGIPYFKPEQEEFLSTLGVTIPDGDYVFYFERMASRDTED